MNAVIVHQVKVLDPRNLPDYLRELDRYVRATDPIVHGITLTTGDNPYLPHYKATWKVKIAPEQLLIPEGPNPAGALPAFSDLITRVEYNRVTSAAALGEALYLPALELLERLNILNIYQLKDLAANRRVKGNHDLASLRDNLESICKVPISFYAKIDPPVPLGTNRANIELDLWADVDVYGGMNGSSWSFESQNPRAMKISARFIDSQQAVLGLRGLSTIFPDARFSERLLLEGLPKNVRGMYRRIAASEEAYWQAYENYMDGLSDQEPYFDERTHREMTSQAGISHLAFLEPIFKKLELHPKSIHYYDDKSNLHYDMKAESLDEVAELVSRGYYNGERIPLIHAVFNGRTVIIELPSGEYGTRIPVAMQIKNGSGKGTLESILSGMNSIA